MTVMTVSWSTRQKSLQPLKTLRFSVAIPVRRDICRHCRHIVTGGNNHAKKQKKNPNTVAPYLPGGKTVHTKPREAGRHFNDGLHHACGAQKTAHEGLR